MLSPNNSPGYIDELLYFYQGNQLVGVDDKTTTTNGGDFVDNFNCYYYTQEPEYGYDANGNLTLDKNKGILNIAYNNLNLPSSIDKTGGYRIAYVYDAAGNKLQQLYYENGNLVKTTDFIGNFVYENDMPSCIVYDEGRVVYANNSRTYFGEVYLKDHLGNVRVACRRENGVLKTRQVDSYYPFGMNIKGLTSNSTDVNRPNEYLYNGKMMQDEMGLGWLDYGARFYDAVLGRWHSPDPLEQYESGYVYGGNNPISMNGPMGMWAEYFSLNINLNHTKSVVNNVGQIIFNDPKSKDKNIYKSPDGKKGSDGNTTGLEDVGDEQPGYDYSVGKYIIPGTNLPVNYRMPQSGNIDIDLSIEELVLGGTVSYKAIKFIARRIARITVKELLQDAAPGNKTKGPSQQWVKKGDISTAEKDFKNLQPKNVKPIQTQYGPGKTGTLTDGKTVTVRPGSSEGSPTVEIRNPLNNRGLEVRYK